MKYINNVGIFCYYYYKGFIIRVLKLKLMHKYL